MNREIKFRAWNEKDKKMCPPLCDEARDVTFVDGSTGRFLDMPNIEDFTLEQYTDFKDKNDTEWYEGEILTDGSDTVVVLWHNGAFRCYRDSLGQHYYYDLPEAQARRMWSVGNIHENPELLEVG